MVGAIRKRTRAKNASPQAAPTPQKAIAWLDRQELLPHFRKLLDEGVPRKLSQPVDDLLLGEVQRVSPAAKDAVKALVMKSKRPNAMFVGLQKCLRSCWYAYRLDSQEDKIKYGMRRDRYYGLADRLRSLADDIQSVNASLIGSPVRYLEGLLDAPSWTQGRKPIDPRAWFERLLMSSRSLPDVLRDCAFALDTRIKRKKPGIKRKPPKHRDIVEDQQLRLLDLVAQTTGARRIAEVITVLEAVALVAGKERDISRRELADRYRRFSQSPGKFLIPLDDDDPEHPILEEFFEALLVSHR